jgi:hypothetical protein
MEEELTPPAPGKSKKAEAAKALPLKPSERYAIVKDDPKLLDKHKALIGHFEKLGLQPYACVLFASHVIVTEDDAAHFGASQTAKWLDTFSRMYPVPYCDAKNCNLMAFVQKMKLSGLDCVEFPEYQQLAAALSG